MQPKKQPDANSAEALKQRLVAMHKFYFKGFDGFSGMQGVINAVGCYQDAKEGILNFGKDGAFWANNAHRIFFRLNEFYAAIPFDRLRGNADFYPLFAANNALKMAEGKLSEALAENEPARIDARSQELEGLLCIIRDWGAVYRARINMLFEKIHKIEGNSDFELELIDINGKSWGKRSKI